VVAEEVLLFCAGCLVLLLEARVRRHPDRYHSNESPPRRPTEVVYLPHSKVVGLHHGAREYPSIASAFVCSQFFRRATLVALILDRFPWETLALTERMTLRESAVASNLARRKRRR
jgi:hypothetical protein